MFRRLKIFIICSLLSLFILANGWSKVTREEAAKLGKELTPLGAERKGNAEGTIPEWTGGFTQIPSGWNQDSPQVDPYCEDKPKFSITAENFEQYKNKLTDGQLTMFKAYPKTFKMNIYQCRRTAAIPEYAYKAAYDNALNAEINHENYDIKGWTVAHPFPIPQNGLEIIYNHIFSYTPRDIAWKYSQAIADEHGNYSMSRMQDMIFLPTKEEGVTPDPQAYSFFYQETLAPPRQAGSYLLVHTTVNKLSCQQRAWVYNPGQRRVRRAPQIAYDGAGTASDGLRTTDDYGMFNGAPDRYNWTLKGKREIYIPYNSYKSQDRSLKYKDVVQGGHLNPQYMRYELHRVWVVEADLKEGMRHIYKKRVFYFDEDSWLIALTDIYDKRHQLWRVGMSHLITRYDGIPYNSEWISPGVTVWYDLQSRRYLAIFLNNEEPEAIDYKTKRTENDFSPAGLRGKGFK